MDNSTATERTIGRTEESTKETLCTARATAKAF